MLYLFFIKEKAYFMCLDENRIDPTVVSNSKYVMPEKLL